MISLVVVALVALPAVTGRDSFPLSSYPMYAEARPAMATFNTAVIIGPDGNWHRLSLDWIANTDDPLVAQSLLSTELHRDGGETLCTEIIDRAPNASPPTIQLVADRVDLQTGQLLTRTVHRECDP